MWAELPDDIKAELKDKRFITRKHNSRGTYASGCRGPLCQKAERDRARARYEELGYKPTPELRVEEIENIDEIIAWHLEDLSMRRKKLAEERRRVREEIFQEALEKARHEASLVRISEPQAS